MQYWVSATAHVFYCVVSYQSKKACMLYQPILSRCPERGDSPDQYLTFHQFLCLLREEENYFLDEYDLKTMTTRLRKIFYDNGGWDILIRQAASVPGRYNVEIVDCSQTGNVKSSELNQVPHYTNNISNPQCRKVTYKPDDRIYGRTRAGCVPIIYKDNHADIQLPEECFCDIGHTLAGLDALNNPQVVTPWPEWLAILNRLFIRVESNAYLATWLGDIATSGADFLYKYLRTGNQNTPEEEQLSINEHASASDMLGNIDAFVIYDIYIRQITPPKKITEIFRDYYENLDRKQKLTKFCELMGLGWDGLSFKNHQEWLKTNIIELRNATAIMVALFSDNPFQKYVLPVQVWLGKYDEIIKPKELLEIFLFELKKKIK
jgi:hypothetical protein